jgi:peptidoglycan hydrolase CwlO-like protein
MDLLLHGDWIIERNGRQIARFAPGVSAHERQAITYGDRTSLEAEVRSLEADLETEKNSASDLEDEVFEASLEIDELNEKIDELNEKIDELEKALNGKVCA